MLMLVMQGKSVYNEVDRSEVDLKIIYIILQSD